MRADTQTMKSSNPMFAAGPHRWRQPYRP